MTGLAYIDVCAGRRERKVSSSTSNRAAGKAKVEAKLTWRRALACSWSVEPSCQPEVSVAVLQAEVGTGRRVDYLPRKVRSSA